MINVSLDGWDEGDLKRAVADRCIKKIMRGEFELFENVPDEGKYTPYDKFKNYVANLVADRIYQYMIGEEEIKTRIDKAISNAEKTIVKQYMKGKGE